MITFQLTPTESVTVVEHAQGRLVVDVTYLPGGKRPPAHLHPAQDERFEIAAGRIGVKLPGERRVCAAGEVLKIPRGTPHVMWNAGDGEARARVQITPALDMEDLFTAAADLAADGHVLSSGMPKPLHLALFVRRFRREVRAPFPPAPVVHALMAPLAALARRRGHDTRYAAPRPAYA